MERIIKIVCEQNKVTEKELREGGRDRKLSECRGMIGWLAKKGDVSTLTEISQRFNRDITTLSRMVNKIEKMGREDKKYGERLLQYYKYATMQA